MSSLRNAAALLATARTFRDLAPLLPPLGFASALPLDADARRELGLDGAVRRASIANGRGTLRALLMELSTTAAPRETVARVAAHVTARSPELLWLFIVVHPPTQTVVVAAPAPSARTRVSALTVDANHVSDADGETLAAMADASGGVDLLVHHRWRELLGRDALTRKFYRELEQVVATLAVTSEGRATARDRRELALLCSSRLLFLAFLEAKGWLDGDREFLRHAFDARCAAGGGVHRRFLDPLFFGTLNTPVTRRAPAARALGRIPFLNGGLFARTPLERRTNGLRFTDESLGKLIGGLLAKYRVTAHESSAAWTEAAIDPEMLGRAFESLMASDDRRTSGAFYTPAPIIGRVAGEGLCAALEAFAIAPEIIHAANSNIPLAEADRGELRRSLTELRVLDPACGSGAFLVHLLERIADLAAAAGDDRNIGARRRDVLTRSIFGVDVNPTAVWLCELRLWLSVVIDAGDRDPLTVAPLPNLDRHIRVGDALAGPAFDGAGAIRAPAALAALRARYARSTGTRKRFLARELDREERRAAIRVAEAERDVIRGRRRDLICAVRSHDLFAARTAVAPEQRDMLRALRVGARQLRRRIAALRSGAPLPFSFPVHFGDAAAASGFHLVKYRTSQPPMTHCHSRSAALKRCIPSAFRLLRERECRGDA